MTNYFSIKWLATVCVFYFSSTLLSQTIDFEKRGVLEFNTYEEFRNSVIIDTVEFGVLKNPVVDLYDIIETKAVIYKRIDDDFEPQLHVWYHFEKKDSAIRTIRYNWGLYNPSFSASKEMELLKRLVKRENLFQEKFSSLESELNSELGKPVKEETIANNERIYIETIFWEDEKKIVGLSITFSRELKENARGEIRADFGIEVTITYK